MENRSYVSLALDVGGIVALVVAGAALAAFKLPLPGDDYAPVFELFSICFCLAVATLLVSRIVEIAAHLSSWEDARAAREGPPTGYREELNFNSRS